MGDNKITSLPGAFGNLRKLRVLDMSENQITKLEKGIENIGVEYIFRLANNPIENIPPELLNIRANIDNTDTKIDPSAFSEEQRAKFSVEKMDPRRDHKVKNAEGKFERFSSLEEAQKRKAMLKEEKLKLKKEKMLLKQKKVELKEGKSLNKAANLLNKGADEL